MSQALIAGWDNYFVIVGSAAGGLTGLTFVVIALVVDAQRVTAMGLRAFVTPSIVYFCTVVGLSAYLSMPAQNLWSLSIGLGAIGIGGVIYAAVGGISLGRLEGGYDPVLEDWLWHAILPALAYALLIAAAVVAWWRAPISLYLVASLLLMLLFIGIHNAWDVAASISLRSTQADKKPQDSTTRPVED